MSTNSNALANGAKALGEYYILPGASLLMDGEVKAGVAHAAVGLAAKALLGPVGLAAFLLVGLNSYSTSVAGKNLKEVLE